MSRFQSRLLPLAFCFAAALLPGCERKSASSGAGNGDGVIKVGPEDAEMSAAIAHAVETKEAFLQALAAPKPNQRDFSVKRPYATGGGDTEREHIWISSLSYDGKLLHGTINDDPVNIPHLKLGDAASFSPSELTDWMYLEDGKVVGGYTIRVLRKRMSAEERAEMDKHLDFKE